MFNVNTPMNRSPLNNAVKDFTGALGSGWQSFSNIFSPQSSNGFNNSAIANHMNSYYNTLQGMGLNDNQVSNLMNSEYSKIQQNDMFKSNNSALGKFDNILGVGTNLLNVGLQGFNLVNSINNARDTKKMNKAKLENLKLNNQAIREELENRRNEIARLNRIRSNVNRSVTQSNEIKTNY